MATDDSAKLVYGQGTIAGLNGEHCPTLWLTYRVPLAKRAHR
ncbi:MAG: hypothetical protein V9G20_08475 [Candidatus Promineifilaceae bacterium]